MQNLRHYSVDLETLGTRPGSAILAIGAVHFNPLTGEELDSFYTTIDPESCQRFGLRIDPGTVMWWMNQSEEARAEIQKGGKATGADLQLALVALSEWMAPDMSDEQVKECVVWGFGSVMDNNLLSEAYEHCGLKRPWTYKHDMCGRTMRNLALLVPGLEDWVEPAPSKPEGSFAHHALHDARYLVDEVCKVLRAVQSATGGTPRDVELSDGR